MDILISRQHRSISQGVERMLGRFTCRRSEQRFVPIPGTGAAAVYYDDRRFEAKVLNKSESGLALRVLADTPFRPGRKVRVVILQQESCSGIISWVHSHCDGSTIGIALVR